MHLTGDRYCGGRMVKPSGSFKTPNWPERDYPAGVTCTWHFIAPSNQVSIMSSWRWILTFQGEMSTLQCDYEINMQRITICIKTWLVTVVTLQSVFHLNTFVTLFLHAPLKRTRSSSWSSRNLMWRETATADTTTWQSIMVGRWTRTRGLGNSAVTALQRKQNINKMETQHSQTLTYLQIRYIDTLKPLSLHCRSKQHH